MKKIIAVTAIMVFGACAGYKIPPITINIPVPTLAPADEGTATSTPEPRTTEVTSPSSTPRPSITPVVTTSPSPAPTFTYCIFKGDPKYTADENESHSQFGNNVKDAAHNYMAEHPDQFDDHFYKFDGSPDGGPSQDIFFQGLIENLKGDGLAACIDKDGGDLIVTDAMNKVGEGRTENMHPISGWDRKARRGRLVQESPFKGFWDGRNF